MKLFSIFALCSSVKNATLTYRPAKKRKKKNQHSVNVRALAHPRHFKYLRNYELLASFFTFLCALKWPFQEKKRKREGERKKEKKREYG